MEFLEEIFRGRPEIFAERSLKSPGIEISKESLQAACCRSIGLMSSKMAVPCMETLDYEY